MSNYCVNPGVGDPPDRLGSLDYNSYCPGEVRLYGRPALRRQIPKMSAKDFEKKIRKELQKNDITAENIGDITGIIKAIMEMIEWNMNSEYIMGIVSKNITFAIYDGEYIHALPIDFNMPSKDYSEDYYKYIKSIGVIYGYAYEGHCYKLPKPQIMFLPEPARNIVPGDCGGDCGYDPKLGYAVWQIDKLERVIALNVRSDDVKTLVLDENMPGSRSPQAYAQSMMLAPQRPHD
ncbi:hypothetical protein BLM14_29490 (plasmid) [Phyllobacterium zundukense]|uniref:hypothetical protein n=1 Tax=Phyllobacterium zundukense TaxID=1867719 RepID=UPI000C1BD2CA|nr:hypothetical protein [Phyllobacterium zundukense]ATU95867.1 hypothetical protein BLM14_29490 [Phyllobacterium zundukense]